MHAHGWDNNTAVKPTGTAVDDGTVFVVGKLTWAASGNNDTLEVFLPGTDLVLPDTAASTLTRDFDQSIFTILGIAGGASASTVRVDEIRFGTSYASVTPVATASTELTLSGFTYNALDGASEVSIKGTANTAYKLTEADDLDFSTPDQDPVPLTGATVGTLDGNQVTTDANGDATVQFNLGTAKAATFIRAMSVE